ncbi:TIM barrel protein [Microbispora sp. GKU 823]|uniref:TIM barrel protein n=1 Tax=Microbispora sp. GKU 823 TaxID=1652100 RepID=UPI001C4E06B8|nr:TIM barrel protein [Microbispora sp. GKU 823]
MSPMPLITGSNFSYQHLPFERFLDDAADLGREELELWGIAPHFHVPQVSDAEARAVRRRAASRGLRVRCLTPEQVAYPVNIASADTRLRASSIAMFRRAAELCAELGAELLLLTPGRGYEDEPVEAAWRRSADALAEIASYAEGFGVTCVLEPLQRVESNLLNDSRALARMLDEVGARTSPPCSTPWAWRSPGRAWTTTSTRSATGSATCTSSTAARPGTWRGATGSCRCPTTSPPSPATVMPGS